MTPQSANIGFTRGLSDAVTRFCLEPKYFGLHILCDAVVLISHIKGHDRPSICLSVRL